MIIFDEHLGSGGLFLIPEKGDTPSGTDTEAPSLVAITDELVGAEVWHAMKIVLGADFVQDAQYFTSVLLNVTRKLLREIALPNESGVLVCERFDHGQNMLLLVAEATLKLR